MNHAFVVAPQNVCVSFRAFQRPSIGHSFHLRNQSFLSSPTAISRFISLASCSRNASQPSNTKQSRPLNTDLAYPVQFARQLHTTQPWLKKPGGIPPKAMPRKSISPRAPDRARIPFGAMSKDALRGIFNQDVPYVEGNEILRMLQDRRTTGALVDKGIQADSPSSIPAESILEALQWLRQKYPVDEKQAAERWAAMESARLEEEYIARAQRLGLYKPADDLDPTAESHHSGQSALEEFQRYNKQKQAREEEKRQLSGEAQKSKELAVARQEHKTKVISENESIVAQKRTERSRAGMVTTDNEIPEMTNSQRLFRPTLFGIAVVVLTAVYAGTYTPVPQKDRMFPDVPVAWTTVGTVVALNVFVWFLWRLPPFWKLLNSYACVVPAYPFTISILINTFSHRQFTHMLSNMLVGVILFGIPVHEELGRANWLYLYITGGVTGSLLSHWYYCLTRQFAYYAQGASGGVFALMAAWAITAYNQPMPSTETHAFALEITRWVVLATSVLGHAIPAAITGIDWASHLGGACAGIVIGGLFHLRNMATAQHESNTDETSDDELVKEPAPKP